MTTTDDPLMVEAMWRAADLTRAYLMQDREQVTACLAGLDVALLERVLCWLALEHDALFEQLGEPSLTVQEIYAVAALAPLDIELATTTAVYRVATGQTGLMKALEPLAPAEQIHAITICTVVMLLESAGRAAALKQLARDTAEYTRLGHPKPY